MHVNEKFVRYLIYHPKFTRLAELKRTFVNMNTTLLKVGHHVQIVSAQVAATGSAKNEELDNLEFTVNGRIVNVHDTSHNTLCVAEIAGFKSPK